MEPEKTAEPQPERRYRVWAQIERKPLEGEEFEDYNVSEPAPIAEFSTLEEAVAFIAPLVIDGGGVAAEDRGEVDPW